MSHSLRRVIVLAVFALLLALAVAPAALADAPNGAREPYSVPTSGAGVAAVESVATTGTLSEAWVATTGDDATGDGSQALPFKTIQKGLDSIAAGGKVYVYPGSYNETASGRTLYNGTGPYQFGLFMATDGVTLQGVKADGTPITAYADVATTITTNATNSFGASGVWVEATDVTIAGLGIAQNIPGDNKTIEVVGENFTLKNSLLDAAYGASVYINDWRYNAGTSTSYLTKYTVEGNWLRYGGSVDISSGAGYTGPAAGRKIINNKFTDDGANATWAVVSFNGIIPAVGWFVDPVGGATVTGNVFSGGAVSIRSRGTVDEASFDWAAYWTGNTFDKAVMATTDGNPAHPRAFDYMSGSSLMNNTKRIGAAIQPEIYNAQTGDTVLVKAGTYLENVEINKANVRLQGAGMDVSTIKGPKNGATPNTVFVGASNVLVDGFTITRDGNTVADWNTNTQSQGISFQQTSTGNTVQNCKFTGNRNAVYVNNAQNVTIRNNVIDFNRTGMQVTNNVSGLVVEENQITNNWTLGIVFNFDTPTLVTSGVTVRNNNISGNWYGEVENRFENAGVMDVSGILFGSTTVTQVNTKSTEPGYADQVPAVYGGTATNPGGAPDISGLQSHKTDYTPYLGVGTDTNVETTAGRGTNGFQGDFSSLYVTAAGAQTGSASRIAEGVSLVKAGGTVNVAAGTYTEPAKIVFNKGVTLLGAGAVSTFIKVPFAGDDLFHLFADGVTIQGFDIEKTNPAAQNLIWIQANNTTIKNNTIHGQYATSSDPVTRAMVTSGGFSGTLIEGNTIYALRQPAYISGPILGEVKNNLTYGTRGWVLESGNLTFTGNTWGSGNAVDIAIIPDCPSTYYTDIAAMSAANNNAVIEDQRTSPRVLSVVYVNAGAAAGGAGGQTDPYTDLNSAFARVAPGGKIIIAGAGTYNVAAGTHPGGIIVNANGTTINLGGATIGHGSPAITINADDVTVNGPGTLDGTGGSPATPGITVQTGADNFTLNGVEIKNWTDGVLVEGSHASLKLVNNWLHDNATGFHFNSAAALSGVVTLEGNLFKFNSGNGIQNDSAGNINALYNAWGNIGGPAAGDGISANVTATPFTFAEIFTQAETPMSVVEGQTFTVEVRADAAGLYAAQYKLTYDATLLQLQSIANGAFGACTTNTATPGVITSYCALMSPAADVNGLNKIVNTITFKVVPDSSHTTGSPWTSYLDLVDDDGLYSAARDGIMAWVNNAGFGAPSVPARDITDDKDGTIVVDGLASFTGYIDLQGRTNDSGALLNVYASGTSSAVLASATSASSGAYTAGPQLVMNSTYYFQVDRALYLPTTATTAASWADFKKLENRPLHALNTVVLLGGDATNNDIIDNPDATCIGGAYGAAPTACGDGPVLGTSDVTGDGKVDILDLTLMGGNYGKSSSPWAE